MIHPLVARLLVYKAVTKHIQTLAVTVPEAANTKMNTTASIYCFKYANAAFTTLRIIMFNSYVMDIS